MCFNVLKNNYQVNYEEQNISVCVYDGENIVH